LSRSRLFSSDPQVIAATVAYITHVAPFYCLFGLGMTLSFASQGAGRMKAPFFAGIARLIVATTGGWFGIEFRLGGTVLARNRFLIGAIAPRGKPPATPPAS
jgi:Na+-driven multidrug efflux pump